jgi:hypothetical protein
MNEYFAGHHYCEHRIAIGRLLLQLRERLCMPGHGGFIKTVTEPPPAGLGMSHAAALNYMAIARDTKANFRREKTKT